MTSRAKLVNMMTIARVPLVVMWMFFAIAEEYSGGFVLGSIGVLAMLLSGLTDLWDGQLARRWKVVSTFGKLADPLMDKIFYVVAFPTLLWLAMRSGRSEAHSLMLLAFTVLYIIRDLWVTFMRAVGSVYGAPVAAMAMGKVRTALSFPTAGWVYLFLFLGSIVPQALSDVWLISCFVLEILMSLLNLISLFTYTKVYMPYIKKALDK
ncbi:MAG: CDP-alcohol phosphatidyltransferase family protein [Kiritimatiellae bacterium]|nr:CDP-alcohol phosphatidyltransferase family protein [Kiritimatiellia bacterium]